MSYVENNLRKDEVVLVKADFSPLVLFDDIKFMVLCILFGVVLKVGGSALIGLIPAEDITSELKSIIDLFDIILTAILIIAIFIGVVVFFLGILELRRKELVITNTRIMGKKGILAVTTLDIPIEKLDSVDTSSTLFGRLFHYESINVRSVGGSAVSEGEKKGKDFEGIKNAMEFKNCATDAIEKHAAEARRAQAAEIAAAMDNRRY